MNRKKMILFYITVILYLFFLTPIFFGDIKVKALATLFIVQILWIGRVFPLAFSSLLLILIVSLTFFSFEETLSSFGSGIVWLLFSTFIISNAFIETGLASRISLNMLRLSRGSGRLLVFISFFLMFVLSILIPSNIGKGSLVTSIFDRISKSMEKISAVPNLSKSLFIGVAYIVAISGAFVATGAGSTIYAYGLLASISPDLNYLNWMIYFGPPTFIFIIILWVIFLVCFPPENVVKTVVMNLIDERVAKLGKISKPEVKIIIIIGFTLLLWVTQSLHGYSVPMVGMLGATLTIMPKVGVWDWTKAKSKIDWDMIIFFGATILLSSMLINTGTIEWLANLLVSYFALQSPFIVLFLFVICTAILRIIFVNVIGFMTIMMPLGVTIGQSISGLTSLGVAMAVFLTGVPGFLLITQSPVHLISHSYGYFSDKDLFRVGIISLFFWLLVVFGSVFFYWNQIFFKN
ncbi:SLC13 family permease [Alkalihalobacillus sp. BA299]|uniref:SLC13 family permease n=1 Tax=Alkalihalobacillus sp. BA299 TaxID=2815938 RepID=UPI001AD9C443|nr:SLC13 family permease [Alkalihalobacillus sp. BA299]